MGNVASNVVNALAFSPARYIQQQSFGTLKQRNLYSFIEKVRTYDLTELSYVLETVWKSEAELFEVHVKIGTHLFVLRFPPVRQNVSICAELLEALEDEKHTEPYTCFECKVVYRDPSANEDFVIPVRLPTDRVTNDYKTIALWCERFVKLVNDTAPLQPSLSTLEEDSE